MVETDGWRNQHVAAMVGNDLWRRYSGSSLFGRSFVFWAAADAAEGVPGDGRG